MKHSLAFQVVPGRRAQSIGVCALVCGCSVERGRSATLAPPPAAKQGEMA